MTESPDTKPKSISSRWVVSISGYDPRTASSSHQLFKNEAKRYADREGVGVKVSRRSRWKRYWSEWHASCDAEGYAENVRFLYLGWDDLIRKYWRRSRWDLFRSAVVEYSHYFSKGLVGQSLRLSKYTVGLFFYPVVVFFLTHGLFAFGGGSLASWLSYFWGSAAMPWVTVWGCVGVCGGLLVSHQLTPLWRGAWMLQIACFLSFVSRKPIPSLQGRMQSQANELVEELLQGEPDELLVVAHSVGGCPAMLLLDYVLADSRWSGRVRLLTLGELFAPIVLFQGKDEYFNQAMYRVTTSPRVEWIDMTMPSDGACYGLVDPLQHKYSEALPYPHEDLPKFISARFMQGYSKKRFRQIRRNGYEYHFRYLMTPDQPADCDYVETVLSNRSLIERFTHRENQVKNGVL